MFKKHTVNMPIEKNKIGISATQIIVFSFFGVIIIGTLLLMLPFATRDGHISFLDAMFTATSATCVTGLVVVDTFSKFTLFGQIIVISMIQIGGLGLVTFTTFFSLILGRRLGLHSLKLASENVNNSNVAQAGSFIKIVMRITFICEAIGAFLLSFAFIPRFGFIRGLGFSAFTSISAFCNAGFDLFGSLSPYSSLTEFSDNPYVLGIIALLIVGGGLGFIVWQDIICFKKEHKFSVHTKLVLIVTGVLIVSGAIFFALLEWNNPTTLGNLTVGQRIYNSIFQSVTTRTAGFNSVDLTPTTSLTKLIMSIYMFIGAAPGGTGGGIKLTTAAILIVTTASIIRGREDATLFGKHIDKKIVYRALAITTLSGVAVCVAGLSIYFYSTGDVTAIDSLFEAASAFGTVGLSVGAMQHLQTASKIVVMLTMFIGRVGPVTLAISLAGRLRTSKKELLPEGQVLIG